jgi:DNA-binding NtrC family response regulator
LKVSSRLLERRALIADRDEQLRQRLDGKLLHSDGTGDGTAALKMLSERRYGVVLVDLELPQAPNILHSMGQIPAAERPIVLAIGAREALPPEDTDVVQMILRRPVDVRQVAELVENCLAAVSDPTEANIVPRREERTC